MARFEWRTRRRPTRVEAGRTAASTAIDVASIAAAADSAAAAAFASRVAQLHAMSGGRERASAIH